MLRSSSTRARVAVVALALSIGALVAGVRAGDPPAADAPQGGAAPPPAKDARGIEADDLVLLAAGEGLGSLDPCDCVQGMLGGFPRRLAVVARERARERAGSGATVFLERGDLSGRASHPALLEAKTRAGLELLAAGGVAAVAVGERDLRLGVETLRRLADAAQVELLGANLAWADPDRGGEPPFRAQRVIEVRGWRVAVVGVLDPDLGDPTGELEITDPRRAVERFVARTPASAKDRLVRVVLFHGSAAAAARHFGDPHLAGVALILCGHDQERARPATRLSGGAGPALVETLRDARALTRVVLPAAGGAAQVDHLPLDVHVPDDPRARARVERYYEEVRGLPEPPRKPTEGGRFVGSSTCMDCHADAYEVFAGTHHAGAQARIAQLDPKRATLAECTVCHVTGFGFQGGFESLERTPELGEVGCEACHGVGGNHVDRGGGRGYGVRPGFPESWRPVCTGCHDPSNSPGFDFERGMERIKHWEDRGR